MKIHAVGTELFHADGWTDRRTEMLSLIVTVCKFANVTRIFISYAKKKNKL